MANALMMCLLAIHALILAFVASEKSPVIDEVAHVAAGVSHWQFGEFSTYSVNPPPFRMLATAPLMLGGVEVRMPPTPETPYARPEFLYGSRFYYNNREWAQWLTFWARCSLIPCSVLGGYVCFRWASDLFGPVSGLLACCLWCTSPMVVGWGALVMPDVPSASFGVLAGFTFHRWLLDANWANAVLAGICLGGAEAAKTSWIVLFALWPLLWFLVSLFGSRRAVSVWASGCQLAVILLIGLIAVSTSFGFERVFERLDSFQFISETLGGSNAHEQPGNVFSDSFLGCLPVPLPAAYLQGIDKQKFDFEVGKISYLRGVQQDGGWWYYYLYAFSVKTPVGILFLALVSGFSSLKSRFRAAWVSECVLLLPALAVVVLISSQTGFNRYLRYALPAYPFLFIGISRVATNMRQASSARKATIGVGLVATVVASMWHLPHSSSFFNVLVGGPLAGPQHLLDANVDWGQDLVGLKRWMQEHPDARPLHLHYFGSVLPDWFGIDSSPVRRWPPEIVEGQNPSSIEVPPPGWYAISVNHLWGYQHYGPTRDAYGYLRNFVPAAYAGYSIYIYELNNQDVERLRSLAEDSRGSIHPLE